jgi:hypothetical protein
MATTTGRFPEEQPLTLDAEQLYARWGFADGEILERYFEAFGVDRFAKPTEGAYADEHLFGAVLVELVQSFLLPHAPAGFAVELYTSHNPIRAAVGDEPLKRENAPNWAKALSVEISLADIYGAMIKVWGAEALPLDRFSDAVKPPHDYVAAGGHAATTRK